MDGWVADGYLQISWTEDAEAHARPLRTTPRFVVCCSTVDEQRREEWVSVPISPVVAGSCTAHPWQGMGDAWFWFPPGGLRVSSEKSVDWSGWLCSRTRAECPLENLARVDRRDCFFSFFLFVFLLHVVCVLVPFAVTLGLIVRSCSCFLRCDIINSPVEFVQSWTCKRSPRHK